jgi:O-antigen ligase
MLQKLRSISAALGSSFALCAIVLVASLVLGGGTRSGFMGDVVLQLIAVPALLIVLARWIAYPPGAPGRRSAHVALVICSLVVALPALQLIPLPPELWSKLAGRNVVGAAYVFIDRELPWMPLSMTPRATWLALLSFIPVVAVFLATIQTGYAGRRALSLTVIGFACFSVFYGMLQVAQGPASPLRLFAITNVTEAVGLFANRNHYAALLYCSLLLMAPWAAAASADLTATSRRRGYPTAVIVAAIASFTIIIMLLSAQIMARSRAGLALAILAIIAALLLPMTLSRRSGETGGTSRILVLAVILAVIFTGQYALDRILERFDTDTLADARVPYARNTLEAAQAHLPFGTGIGSFVSIYGAFEKPADIHRTFANRAHNDLLEALLETGALGLALFSMFVLWLAARTLALLRSQVQSEERIDALLARAAMIGIVLLIVHSLADYPLRTGAMAAVFAFFCGLLIPPPPGANSAAATPIDDTLARRSRSHGTSRRGRSTSSPSMSSSVPGASYSLSSGRTSRQSADQPAPPIPEIPGQEAPLPRPPRSAAANIAWPSTSHASLSSSAAPDAGAGRGGKWANEGPWPEEWQSAPKPASPGEPPPPPPIKPEKSR